MYRHLVKKVLLICGVCLALAACKSAEDRAEDYFVSAQELLASGDADRAIVELRNVFQLVPNHAEARRSMARLMLERGDAPRASYHYVRLIEQRPDDIEGRTALAELAFDARDWDAFALQGERAMALAPDAARSKAIGLALAYRAAVLDKDTPAADAARDSARSMADELDGGNKLLEQILFDDHVRAGQTEAALAQLDRMIARTPDQRGYYDQRLALLRQMGNQDAIEAHLRRVVETFADDDEAKSTLVQYLMATGAHDKAEAFLREIADPTAADPAYFISLVQFLQKVRNVDAARAELDAGIAVSPQPDQLRALRAALDFDHGQRDTAIADLQAILDRIETPDTTGDEAAPVDTELANEVRIALSRMLRATDNEPQAQRLLEEVLDSDSSNITALKIRAAQMIDADDADAAIANLRRVLDFEPEDVAALTLMADAHFRAGSPDLARDFVAQAVSVSNNAPQPSLRHARLLMADGNDRAAEEVLLTTLRRVPEHAEILTVLGQIYLSRDDFGRAGQVADQLRGIGSAPATTAANQLQMQLVAQREGTTEALSLLEDMAQSDEAGLNEQMALLRARLATGQPQEALQFAEDLAAADPANIDRRFLLAITRAATGDLPRARTDMQAIVNEEPTRALPWQQLYRMTRTVEGPDAASAVLEAALEANPAAPALLWMRAAELEQVGDIDGAIAVYETLYAGDTNSMIFANNLASLLVTYRDDTASLDRAWTIARRLRDTDVPAFQDTYGWLAFRRGDPGTALPYLEEAAQGLPQDPIVQYHLAEVYAALNRTQDAIAAYQRVLDTAGTGDARTQIGRAQEELTRLRQAAAEEDSP